MRRVAAIAAPGDTRHSGNGWRCLRADEAPAGPVHECAGMVPARVRVWHSAAAPG